MDVSTVFTDISANQTRVYCVHICLFFSFMIGNLIHNKILKENSDRGCLLFYHVPYLFFIPTKANFT
jgi:hypothetical protein